MQRALMWLNLYGCETASPATCAKGSHDFFHNFRIHFSNYINKNPQTTIAPTFLAHIISAVGGVEADIQTAIANLENQKHEK
jgi:hypothetical protein